MKSGIVLIPFVDGKTGKPYEVNDNFKAQKKRFEELLKAGLISDGKEVSEENEEAENIQNEEITEEEIVDEVSEENEEAE